MSNQKILAAFVFALVTASFNASAAIINQVDFPDSFVQSKDKQITEEPVSAAVHVKK